MKEPIRLTNKTAIALRKSAQKVRTAYYAAATLLSVGMAAAAVYFGIKWLPAVPIMVTACVLADCAIVTHARSQYLLLIGQAICTEAAARDIRMGGREQKRKERAINDLLEAKADIRKTEQKKEKPAQPFFEKGMSREFDQAMLEGKTVVIPGTHMEEETDGDADGAPRRRRQQKSLQLIRNNRAK